MSALDELTKVFLEAKTEEEMKNLLTGILTPAERVEFAQRLEIVRMLKKGISQHEIAKRLKVGVATVTRGSKEIKQGNFKYVSS